MIDYNILSKMFKSNNIHYYNNGEIYGFIEINVKNKKIVIMKNQSYFLSMNTLKTNCLKRKNCWILNSSRKTKPCLYFQEDYIHYIIRQKFLNKILND